MSDQSSEVTQIGRCRACSHWHTADGCVGGPTPADLRAGAHPGDCGCPGTKVSTTPGEASDQSGAE